MMVTIAKRFTFDAAHHLPTMPEGHKCRRMHGHTYEVELVLRGKVDSNTGILLDYAEIAAAWSRLYEALDHRNLNEVIKVPSTENLVAFMFDYFDSFRHLAQGRGEGRADRFWELLHVIRIKESSSTWCEMSKVEWLAFCGVNA